MSSKAFPASLRKQVRSPLFGDSWSCTKKGTPILTCSALPKIYALMPAFCPFLLCNRRGLQVRQFDGRNALTVHVSLEIPESRMQHRPFPKLACEN